MVLSDLVLIVRPAPSKSELLDGTPDATVQRQFQKLQVLNTSWLPRHLTRLAAFDTCFTRLPLNISSQATSLGLCTHWATRLVWTEANWGVTGKVWHQTRSKQPGADAKGVVDGSRGPTHAPSQKAARRVQLSTLLAAL